MVARELAGVGPVVITGSRAEFPLVNRVRQLAGLPESAVLAGRTSLRRLAALVADARLVICGDTGVAHLASAYRTPSVVLCGPISPALWGPPPDGPHVALWHGARDVDDTHTDWRGDPHGDQPDPALLAISPAEVIRAAGDLLLQPAAR